MIIGYHTGSGGWQSGGTGTRGPYQGVKGTTRQQMNKTGGGSGGGTVTSMCYNTLMDAIKAGHPLDWCGFGPNGFSLSAILDKVKL
ncbi:MAG: hypothetical protein QXU18_10975 [Thermoplasmatales archaeon]